MIYQSFIDSVKVKIVKGAQIWNFKFIVLLLLLTTPIEQNYRVISKGLYDNDTFLKTSISGEFNFIKRPKRPDTESFKIAGLSRTFSA